MQLYTHKERVTFERPSIFAAAHTDPLIEKGNLVVESLRLIVFEVTSQDISVGSGYEWRLGLLLLFESYEIPCGKMQKQAVRNLYSVVRFNCPQAA